MFDMAAAEAMELEDEDPIEIPEEADLIEAERCIEDDVDLGVGRDGERTETWRRMSEK